MTLKNSLRLIVRIFLGGLFALSGWLALTQPIEYFQLAVNQYQLLPDPFVEPASYAIAWTELIVGTFLLLGYSFPTSARIIAGLILIFEIVLALAIFRNLPVRECGCLGGLVTFTPAQTYIIVSVLLWLAFWVGRNKAIPLAVDNFYQ